MEDAGKRNIAEKNAEIRENIIRTQGLKERASVLVETKDGPREGTIISFDETRRVWVQFPVIDAEEQGRKRDIQLFEPIDIELKN